MVHPRSDSIVLTTINTLNKRGEPFSIRTLVQECNLADRTITRAIRRLEKRKLLEVNRKNGKSKPHTYTVLKDPTKKDELITSIHLDKITEDGEVIHTEAERESMPS